MRPDPGGKSKYKTIMQIAAEMQRHLTPTQAWTVGAQIRERWLAELGHLPEKDLRAKARERAGSHMLAIYPPAWHQRIRNAIDEVQAGTARQMDLFCAPAIGMRQSDLPF